GNPSFWGGLGRGGDETVFLLLSGKCSCACGLLSACAGSEAHASRLHRPLRERRGRGPDAALLPEKSGVWPAPPPFPQGPMKPTCVGLTPGTSGQKTACARAFPTKKKKNSFIPSTPQPTPEARIS